MYSSKTLKINTGKQVEERELDDYRIRYSTKTISVLTLRNDNHETLL